MHNRKDGQKVDSDIPAQRHKLTDTNRRTIKNIDKQTNKRGLKQLPTKFNVVLKHFHCRNRNRFKSKQEESDRFGMMDEYGDSIHSMHMLPQGKQTVTIVSHACVS